MFTGLVLERGRLSEPPTPSGEGGRRLALALSADLLERLALGDSLAVGGVCLTVTERRENPPGVAVELAPETLRRTRLGDLREGDEVNLEPALRAGDALGGHWVQGHVDGTVRVLDRRDLERHRELDFELPSEHQASVVEKGSIALDGVSLTVASCSQDRFAVALLPHTLEVTTLGRLEPGDRVHLEIDVLAKYVARYVAKSVEQALAARGLSG